MKFQALKLEFEIGFGFCTRIYCFADVWAVVLMVLYKPLCAEAEAAKLQFCWDGWQNGPWVCASLWFAQAFENAWRLSCLSLLQSFQANKISCFFINTDSRMSMQVSLTSKQNSRVIHFGTFGIFYAVSNKIVSFTHFLLMTVADIFLIFQ